MHTFSETGAGVPAFLAKLWRLVDDPDTNNLICWSKDGRSFIIQNQAQFARELLPLNYKHNNMASFIRQLNMYGFHKITSIDNGGLKFDRDEMEFSHPCFKRNCPYLLEHIKRKIANTKSLEDKSGLKPEAVSKVLQDVKAMRGRQDSLDSRFSVMKQENEALWREIASLRQKHAKQQQIVNKLIQFLITIVQPSRNMTSVKRHMQLMINDTPENAKLRKSSESESECGPVIHELGEVLLDEVADAETDLIDQNSPYAKMESASHGRDNDESPSPLHIERPHSSISQVSQHYDYSNQSVEDALMAAANGAGVGGSSGSGSGSGSGEGGATLNNSPVGAVDSAIIQSVNPDGSRIFYHVTEVPDATDAQSHETVTAASPNYNEENVLTTPMVREQMARSQQLKQKNKQRRKQAGTTSSRETAAVGAVVPTPTKMQRLIEQKQQPQPQVQSPPPLSKGTLEIAKKNAVKIKAEKEIDPMSFLNVCPDERVISPDLSMNEDSRPSSVNAGLLSSSNGNAVVTAATLGSDDHSLLGSSTDFYNPNDFISGDMPADIFEDSSIISNDADNYNNQGRQQQQEQLVRSVPNNGKFSPYVAGNNNNSVAITSNANGASTSAAAAAAAAAANNNQFGCTSPNGTAANSNGNGNKEGGGSAGGGALIAQNKNGNNMAVAKYKSEPIPNEDIMRLSTPDEVSGHLENVQDELESLKDLLRSDVYSLDANTLMGNGALFANACNQNASQNNRVCLPPPLDGDLFNKLFNDSDILGPYGLAFSNENSNDKKGSELMTYQPIYDLSDIIDINEKNELEAVDTDTAAASSSMRPLQQLEGASTLNTPYHE